MRKFLLLALAVLGLVSCAAVTMFMAAPAQACRRRRLRLGGRLRASLFSLP